LQHALAILVRVEKFKRLSCCLFVLLRLSEGSLFLPPVVILILRGFFGSLCGLFLGLHKANIGNIDALRLEKI